MYISLWEILVGIPIICFMQFSTKIDGFEQNDSQGFENSSYEQYPLENFFIFTIYQNYTLALREKQTENNIALRKTWSSKSQDLTEKSLSVCKLAIYWLHSPHEVFITSVQITLRQNSKLRSLTEPTKYLFGFVHIGIPCLRIKNKQTNRRCYSLRVELEAEKPKN